MCINCKRNKQRWIDPKISLWGIMCRYKESDRMVYFYLSLFSSSSLGSSCCFALEIISPLITQLKSALHHWYNGHSRYVQTKQKYDYYSNSSFSLTLEWPTSGENLPKAFRRTELTFKVPGIGVDDLCNSQGFFGFRREVWQLDCTGFFGCERGSDPLLLKSLVPLQSWSSDNSLMFVNEALFLIEVSASRSESFSGVLSTSICFSFRRIPSVAAALSTLLLFLSVCGFCSMPGLEESVFCMSQSANDASFVPKKSFGLFRLFSRCVL